MEAGAEALRVALPPASGAPRGKPDIIIVSPSESWGSVGGPVAVVLILDCRSSSGTDDVVGSRREEDVVENLLTRSAALTLEEGFIPIDDVVVDIIVCAQTPEIQCALGGGAGVVLRDIVANDVVVCGCGIIEVRNEIAGTVILVTVAVLDDAVGIAAIDVEPSPIVTALPVRVFVGIRILDNDRVAIP